MRVRQQFANRRGPHTSSVQDDWYAWLPASKAEVYASLTRELETPYNILSVALDEALELRKIGRLSLSAEALSVVPELCKRLANPLTRLLRALGQHARHYGIVPNVAPLNAAHFRGARGQRAARMNDLLTRVLLSQRSQFLHKITAVQELSAGLVEDCSAAAEDIGLGVSLRPDADWQVADTVHYDLNTCLREALILLKCFMVIVPEDQLGVFHKAVVAHLRAPELPSRSRPIVQPKRMAAAGGK